jgi:hypothetical protein
MLSVLCGFVAGFGAVAGVAEGVFDAAPGYLVLARRCTWRRP